MPDIRLPDGRIIKNVPQGTTKEDLTKKLIGKGLLTGQEDFIQKDKSLISKIGTATVEGLAGFTEGLGRAAVGATQFGAELIGQEDFAGKIGQQIAKEKELEKNDPTARKVGRFIGGIAPALPVGAGMGLIKGGIAGGAAAELIQPTETGTAKERVQQTVIGAGLGGLTGGALLGAGKAVKGTAGAIKRQFTATKPEDVIAKGIRPEDAQPILDQLQEGKIAIIPDVAGDEVKGLTRSIAKLPQAKDVITDALEGRSFGAVKRVSEQLSKDISPVGAYFGNIDDLAKARSEIAAPLYKKAFEKGTVLDVEKNRELFEKIAPDIADARKTFRLGKAPIKSLNNISGEVINEKELLEGSAGSSGITDKELLFDIADNYKKAIKIINDNKPKRLIQYIKEQGGVSDYKGELKSLGVDNKTLPGFLRKEGSDGISIDNIGEKLQEVGFFSERPTISEVLNLIGNDVNNSNVFIPSKNQNLYDEALGYIDNVDRSGIDTDLIKNLKRGQTQILSQEINKNRIADNSIVMLDAAKKSLDDKIGKAIRQGERQEASILQGIKKELVSKLDEINPDYKKARQVFSDFASIQNAQEQGLNIVKKGITAEQVKKMIKEMSVAEKDAFRIGLREGLDRIVRNTSIGNDPAKKIFNDLSIVDKIKASLGDGKKFIDFKKRMQEEIAAADTRFKVLGGSRSDFNLSGDDVLDKIVSGVEVVGGSKTELLKTTVNALKNRAAGLNKKNAKQVAEILVNREKGIEALQNIINKEQSKTQKRILIDFVKSLRPEVAGSQAIQDD